MNWSDFISDGNNCSTERLWGITWYIAELHYGKLKNSSANRKCSNLISSVSLSWYSTCINGGWGPQNRVSSLNRTCVCIFAFLLPWLLLLHSFCACRSFVPVPTVEQKFSNAPSCRVNLFYWSVVVRINWLVAIQHIVIRWKSWTECCIKSFIGK